MCILSLSSRPFVTFQTRWTTYIELDKMGLLQKVVRNEAMKSDPPEIYGWRVFMLACSACFGGMLFGWDIGQR